MFKWIKSFIQWIYREISYKKRIEQKMDMLFEQNIDNKLELLRIKYLFFYYHSPLEVTIISSIFDEYKKLGGDSWIDDLHETWKKNLRKGVYKRKAKK